MIPTFVAIQEELKPQYEHIKEVGRELEQLRTDFNVSKIKQVKPEKTTSFMPRKGSQAVEYD